MAAANDGTLLLTSKPELVIRSEDEDLEAFRDFLVQDFDPEKEAEGFSLDEINTLYAVELPLLFGYWREGGRIRAQYDGQIVER